MSFTREQEKIAYTTLPEQVRDFVMSNETTELVTEALGKTGFNEEVSTTADSEILYAMMGLQTLDMATENIAKLANRPLGDLVNLKSELQAKIFDKIKALVPEVESSLSDLPMVVETPQEKLGGRVDLIQEIENPKPTPERPSELQISEELKLEPPKVGGSLTSLAPVNTPKTPQDKPKNLIDEKLKQVVATPIKTSTYPGGLDPYREPTQ